MADDSAILRPGWYVDESGIRRYWSGTSWLTPEELGQPIVAAPAPIEGDCNTLEESSYTKTLMRKLMIPFKRRRTLIAVGVALVTIVTGTIIVSMVVQNVGGIERDASAQCQTELINQLKSPSTAAISDLVTYDAVETAEDTWARLSKALGSDIGSPKNQAFLAEKKSDAATQMTEDAKQGKVDWMVRGIVDSENGFGARIRNNWACDISFTSGKVTDGPNVEFFDK